MPDNEIMVVEGDEGILVLGPENLLTQLDEHRRARARRLDSSLLARIGQALGAVSDAQERSGRWMKLDEESSQYLRTMGITRIDSGVVRRKDIPGARGGQITKHLGFEDFALVTPAAPAALAAMATQAALEASLDEIMQYLVAIDAKLDRLLEQRKVEVRGQLGGIALAIDEAAAIHQSTGTLSEVTWSKVQSNTLTLQTLQVEAVAQLQALADHVKRQAKNTDQAAQALEDIEKDVTFWLEVLARTLVMQDRQYILELARVESAEPDQLEAHRAGIVNARSQRTERMAASLDSIITSVRDCTELSDFNRVINPISAPRVTALANDINQTIAHFAEHADLQLIGVDERELQAWSEAAKSVLGEAASKVSATSASLAGKVKRLGSGLQDRHVLPRISKIREKHQLEVPPLAEIEPPAEDD